MAHPPRRPARRLPLALAPLALALLSGCATPPSKAPPWRIDPLARVSDPRDEAQAHYLVGRYEDGSRRWEAAARAYAKAVAAHPGHVDALNALGVATARLGRLEEAERWLRHAQDIAPRRADVLANLGLVLLRQRRDEAAWQVLQAARGLDPGNPVTERHWRTALSRQAVAAAGAGDEAAPEARPAIAVRSEPTVPALAMAVSTVPGPEPTTGRATDDAVPAPSPASQRATANDAPLRVEVVNGFGRSGAAARAAGWMKRGPLASLRLRNEAGFARRETVLEYAPAARARAERLAAALPRPVRLLPARSRGSDLRLLLGRDWAEVDSAAPGLAAAGRPGPA